MNEGLSHLAEELAGAHVAGLGDAQRFERFRENNLLNAFRYLKNHAAHGPVYADGFGTVEERGATWLLLRWLVDRADPSLIRLLSETDRTGLENVEWVGGRPLDELLPLWFVATHSTGLTC